MLLAQELRIGNLVWEEYSGEMIVFGIVTGGINPRVELRKKDDLPAGSYTIESIKGIPLSTYWLERAGFVGDSILGTQTLYKKDNVDIWAFRNDNTFMLDNIKRKYVYLKFVHQLQNLYFSLTGTELEIK